MPTEVLPIRELGTAGLVQDTPAVSLPPNVFTNAENVRFRDGAARKMTGEAPIPAITAANTVYSAFWPGPINDYWVLVSNVGQVTVYNAASPTPIIAGTMTTTADSLWQHTLFNGGFHFILNNGTSTPMFLSDPVGAGTLTELPNWDSYLTQETLATFEYSAQYADISLGQDIPRQVGDATLFADMEVRITIVPRDTSSPIVTQTFTGIGTQGMVTLHDADANNEFPYLNRPGIVPGDIVTVAVVQTPAINVRAGIIRSYGNLLVAGNLTEQDAGGVILRRLPGTVRTSDVAAPGAIPRNWNPFRLGVNTADEFILSSTGVVQDMVELQGILYIYTDSSIHALQQTGSPQIPFQISPVTDSYGVDNTGGVLEVDGKHIVVGNDDVYVFAGHPGSISSIADGKVRHQDFWDSGPIYINRFQKYDELWFWKPADAEMYIWNYRDNTWTRRNQTAPVSMADREGTPILAISTGLRTVDDGFATTSFVERKRLAVTPEFDTEYLASMAMLSRGNGTFDIRVIGTNATGVVDADIDLDPSTSTALSHSFNIIDEYKQDIRVHGRFLNYRITHIADTTMDNGFVLAGMQLDIGKGGTR